MTIRFFLDENMPKSSAEILKDLGFEVEHARTAGFRGKTDEEIAKYAKEQGAVLVTKDLDFGNMLWYPKGSHYGLLIIRLPHDYSAKQITSKLKEFISNIDVEELVDHITILELGRYRVREI
ncbi:MAG: DUF5615 family PIN-like protein [Candidatus Natronoplasma sp.]